MRDYDDVLREENWDDPQEGAFAVPSSKYSLTSRHF